MALEVRGDTTDTAEQSHELQRLIDALHDEYQSLTDGDVATYIPELGKADPEHFGIAVVTASGRVFEAGHCDAPFTIQSISKPFTFGMALEEFGQDRVWQHVDVEPSGDAFNSIELQNGTNRPHNPMVNSGADSSLVMSVSKVMALVVVGRRGLQPSRRRRAGGRGPSGVVGRG